MAFRVLISGGGTGGHIYPAVAVADALRELFPGVEILFVGALGRMEMERVPKAGYSIVGLPSQGMPRSKNPLKLMRFLWSMLRSVVKAWGVVRRFKPNVAIGIGGYVSAPPLMAAQWQGVPTMLLEPNGYVGKANEWLGKKARVVCVAYEGLEAIFPKAEVVLTGSPIRGMVSGELPDRIESRMELNLPLEGCMVLVQGGSLGAANVNRAILQSLELLYSRKDNYFVVLQTGAKYYDEVRAQVADYQGGNLYVYPFLDNMGCYYGAADVIVARAGASTIAELCVVGKPVVLVPSPNVVEDHQTKNAQALEREGAVLMVRDADAIGELMPTVDRLLQDEGLMESLSQAILKKGRPNAARAIAQIAWNRFSGQQKH